MDNSYVDLAFPGQAYNEKVRELHASYAPKRMNDDSTADNKHARKRNLLSMLASLFV